MKPLTSTTPHVIIMVGIPGAGKSTFAGHFANTFQSPLVSHQALMDAAPVDEATSAQITTLLLDELLKTQRTLVYDGPTQTRASRLALTKKIVAAGYKPLLVWVQTESLEAKRRAMRTRTGTTTLSADEFDAALRRFSSPTIAEKPVVISGKHTYASQLKIVLKRLAEQSRPEPPDMPRSRPGRTVILR